jgi:acyl-CoA thioester hydrolase
MSAPFEFHSDVGWFDLDANRHMKNVAYMEKSVDCRLRFFARHGYDPAAFARLGVTFVVVRDETLYKRELFLGDNMRVQMLSAGVNAKKSRFLCVNRILDEEGGLIYEIRSMIVWLDTHTRRACMPPDAIAALIDGLARTEDYALLT